MDEWNPLHHAALENHSNVVPFLLNAGYDVDEQDLNGATPLHVAAENNSIHALATRFMRWRS